MCPISGAKHRFIFCGNAIIRTRTKFYERGVYRCACGQIKRKAPMTFDRFARHLKPPTNAGGFAQ